MDSISPVVPGLEAYEQQGQPAEEGGSSSFPYLKSPEGIVVMRWQPTEEERKRIADGEDIYLSVLTMNKAFQPVKMDVGVPFDGPENLKRKLRLEDELELRQLLAQRNTTAAKLQKRQVERIQSDEKCRELGEQLERDDKALAHKEGEVFSDKPAPKIEVVQ